MKYFLKMLVVGAALQFMASFSSESIVLSACLQYIFLGGLNRFGSDSLSLLFMDLVYDQMMTCKESIVSWSINWLVMKLSGGDRWMTCRSLQRLVSLFSLDRWLSVLVLEYPSIDPYLTHMMYIVSSLVEAPRPEQGVSDKGDI